VDERRLAQRDRGGAEARHLVDERGEEDAGDARDAEVGDLGDHPVLLRRWRR